MLGITRFVLLSALLLLALQPVVSGLRSNTFALGKPVSSRGNVHVRGGHSTAHADTAQESSEAEDEMISLKNDMKLKREVFGVPMDVLPYYAAFMLDSIAVGLVMPLLPFYIMELGANALQLSLVVSANYVAQMIGCLVMGKVSDLYGRRMVMLACLSASSLSYWCVSYAKALPMVALARIISGGLGGLMPIMQSAVADSTSLSDRPKYMGRISAAFGMGFVLGPALSTALPGLTTEQKMRIAACLPLVGFLVTLLFARETKRDIRAVSLVPKFMKKKTSPKEARIPTLPTSDFPLTKEVIALVLNGFLIMYAFGTETIYAIFIKDAFGYGEVVLSGLFAVNGLLMGLFQVFLIKPLIGRIGQHATLALGNMLLALGMLGLAVARDKVLHFALFSCHILGYSIADTALVSLVSRYSAASSQGRDLALNQAAQACARIFSPLIAGLLYERSKKNILNGKALLPLGALPFIAGGLCPLVAVVIPALLYARRIAVAPRVTRPVTTAQGVSDEFTP